MQTAAAWQLVVLVIAQVLELIAASLCNCWARQRERSVEMGMVVVYGCKRSLAVEVVCSFQT